MRTFATCNPAYTYSSSFNPRRVLSKPAEPVGNNGFDNENADLILSVGMNLCSPQGYSYRIVDLLGQGTFGQVVKCVREDNGDVVAVKVVKNLPAYFHQARVEVGILQMLNARCESDKTHIVKLLDYFVFEKHLCMSFELLGINLYELIRHNHYKGLSINLLRLFVRQILVALMVLREANVVHCDVKPENILLKSLNSGELKLIDYGSACFHNRTVYSYIQSRFYRCPEVMLGHPYGMEIDMWSLGCVAAELFFGLPLFPGTSEYDMILRITQMLGPMPDGFLERCSKLDRYFKYNNHVEASKQTPKRYLLISETEFEQRHNTKYLPGKRYFKQATLREIVMNYPSRKGLSAEELEHEKIHRECFLDFLLGVLRVDPEARWTPRQAASHPFITGQKYAGPYIPVPESRPAPYSIPQAIGVPGVQTNGMAPLGGSAIHTFASHLLGVSPIGNYGHTAPNIGLQYASDPLGMANHAFLMAATQHQLHAQAGFNAKPLQAFPGQLTGASDFQHMAGTSMPGGGAFLGGNPHGLMTGGDNQFMHSGSASVPIRREVSVPSGLASMHSPNFPQQSYGSPPGGGPGSPHMQATMTASAAIATTGAPGQSHIKPHGPPSPRRRAARLADASSFPYPHVPSRLSVGSGGGGGGMLAAEAERSDTPPTSSTDWNPMFTEEAFLDQHSPPGKISGGSQTRTMSGSSSHGSYLDTCGSGFTYGVNARNQAECLGYHPGDFDSLQPSDRQKRDKHPRR